MNGMSIKISKLYLTHNKLINLNNKDMLTQDQIKEIANKQAQLKKNSASLLVLLGTVLTAIACYGFLANQDSDWSVVLLFGSIVTIYGVISGRE